MNKIISVLGLILIVGIAACTQTAKIAEDSQTFEKEEFYEQIPLIDAYYQGEKVWFIHTDVTSPEMAERLTAMVNYQTVFAPRNSDAVNVSKIEKIYVFTNGIDQKDTEPWGGGPFNFQIDIVGSIPGDEAYTSIRSPALVTWEDSASPRILKSVEELFEAEANGELTIKNTPVVVNVPMVRWPRGGTSLE